MDPLDYLIERSRSFETGWRQRRATARDELRKLDGLQSHREALNLIYCQRLKLFLESSLAYLMQFGYERPVPPTLQEQVDSTVALHGYAKFHTSLPQEIQKYCLRIEPADHTSFISAVREDDLVPLDLIETCRRSFKVFFDCVIETEARLNHQIYSSIIPDAGLASTLGWVRPRFKRFIRRLRVVEYQKREDKRATFDRELLVAVTEALPSVYPTWGYERLVSETGKAFERPQPDGSRAKANSWPEEHEWSDPLEEPPDPMASDPLAEILAKEHEEQFDRRLNRRQKEFVNLASSHLDWSDEQIGMAMRIEAATVRSYRSQVRRIWESTL